MIIPPLLHSATSIPEVPSTKTSVHTHVNSNDPVLGATLKPGAVCCVGRVLRSGLSEMCRRVCSESGRRFFEFLEPVFEVVLNDSKLYEVSAQLCDRPLDPPARMSKLAVNGVEAFELDL